MKSKLLIASLGLVAASAYAQPSIPAGGASPSVNRPEVSPTSMPQPAMQRPAPQPAVGATGGNGGNGGNGGLMIGNGGNGGNSARPAPPSTISSGPLPANNAKAPTSVGSMSEAQAESLKEIQTQQQLALQSLSLANETEQGK
ncbi:hypothetical protein AOC19_03015 [Polynucleobacter asymbioticus]|uniref:hypothetical protein n=1 Tax=Polynucleobacter asymbioticus TaxID=576611 RepID=UPI001BFE73E8|nr:hypothetical protein [Polynucleobacter asymbioticus]QWD86262.1 hypothetical protein AOC19_03015 [Polynucleobacter asymbioticus]